MFLYEGNTDTSWVKPFLADAPISYYLKTWENVPLNILAQPVITCSKLKIETLEQVANFQHILHLVLVFLLLTLEAYWRAWKLSETKFAIKIK